MRLKQGLMDQATVFSDEPAEMALHWVKQGARRLHLVDLDGAFAGKPKNLEAISAILQEVGKTLPVQLGGVGGASQLAPAQAAGTVMALTIWVKPLGNVLARAKVMRTLALPPAGTLAMVTGHRVPAAAPAVQVVVPPSMLVKVALAGTTSFST